MPSSLLSHRIRTSCSPSSCMHPSSFSASFLTGQFLFSLIPTVFLPIPLLAYASLLGIASTVFLIGVVFVDGLSKFDAPGSLWIPAKTSFGFCNLEELGLAFGLFMAGVCSLSVSYNMYTISRPTHPVRRPRSPPFSSSGHG